MTLRFESTSSDPVRPRDEHRQRRSDLLTLRLGNQRETNLVCLRTIAQHGPTVVPGLDQDLNKLRNETDPSKSFELPKRGLAVLPAIVALDPIGGRRLVESQIVDPGLTNSELLSLASQLLPPPSAVARDALRARLGQDRIDQRDGAALLLALIRFSDRSDATFVRGRLSSVSARERARSRRAFMPV